MVFVIIISRENVTCFLKGPHALRNPCQVIHMFPAPFLFDQNTDIIPVQMYTKLLRGTALFPLLADLLLAFSFAGFST